MKNSLKNLVNTLMSPKKPVNRTPMKVNKLRAAAKKASNARVAAANKAVQNYTKIVKNYSKPNTSVTNAAMNAARKKAQAAVNAV